LLKGDWEPGAEQKFGCELQEAMGGRGELHNEFLTIFAFPRIRPVLSYGAKAWALTKKEEQVLLIFERKIFRRI